MALVGYQEVAAVKFIEGTNTTKTYHFALYDHAVDVGDYALVKSRNTYGSGSYGVVKVIGIVPASEFSGSDPTAEIISKIDMSAYEVRCEKRKNREALKKQMDKIVEKNQKILVYQTVAENNPEMAALLSAYLETMNA